MNDEERQFEDFVSNIKFDDTPDSDHRNKLEQDLLRVLTKQPRHKQQPLKIWRIIMKSRITKLTAAAVIIIVLMLGINYLDAPIDGASTVFAVAMDRVKQARTFSCIRTMKSIQNGQVQKFDEMLFMFKEPDLERRVRLTSKWDEYIGEIHIIDFSKRQELYIRPANMTAFLEDKSSDYTINSDTGELELTQLNTGMRDRLLKWTMGAVEDLGDAELDGKSVRKLQSQGDDHIVTVWLDPKTNMPIQIELNQLKYKQIWMYKSIQIDTNLDDSLFSLEPPEGYDFKISTGNWPDDKEKMGTKIMHLGKFCLIYANKHDDQFPGELADLVTSGITTDEVLKKILASPEEPNGPPVFRYRQPDTSVADWSIEVMLYEVYEKGSGDDQVVVTLLDSHSELVPVQVLEQYLKPWPANKKRVSACMVYLYGHCDRYAKEHEGQYPSELADLAREDLSVETIQRLRSAWGQRDGCDAIWYRLPNTEADPSTEVMFYEIYDQWPDGGAVVCYADGRCEMILDQNRFEELIR